MVGPTATFSDGNAYPASVVGTDPYVNLAVVAVQAPQAEFHPLQIGNSSQLVVGKPVVAIGNPFGPSGSMTFGIVSQLGRTLSESLPGNFAIADVIQFSAPINLGTLVVPSSTLTECSSASPPLSSPACREWVLRYPRMQ